MRELERCCICDEPTGGAGKDEDSLYCEKCDAGPFCEGCYDDFARQEAYSDSLQDRINKLVLANKELVEALDIDRLRDKFQDTLKCCNGAELKTLYNFTHFVNKELAKVKEGLE